MEIGPMGVKVAGWIRVWCECGDNHGFTIWRDGDLFWVEVIPMSRSFFQRFRDAWNAFRGRSTDETVLSHEQIEALADALDEELCKADDEAWENTIADGLEKD